MIEHYDAAIRMKPDDPETLNNYGVFLCRNKRGSEGAKMMLRAARSPLYSTPEVAFNNAGVCYRNAGNLVDAETKFPGSAEDPAAQQRCADEQLAQMNFDREQYGDARALCAALPRKLAASSADILWLAMRTEQALKNTTAAETYARRLKKEFPTSQQARSLTTAKN